MRIIMRNYFTSLKFSVLLLVSLWLPATNSATCDKIDSCTCEMSDGSGQINFKGIGLQGGTDSLYTLNGLDGWLYKYNPCYGFTSVYYYDLAIAQTTGNGLGGYDLGNQTSAEFSMSPAQEVTIQYTASDGDRTSRVLLVCESGTNEHKLDFVGELITTEYDFIHSSPCACPGLCDNNGILNPVVTVSTVPGDSGQVVINVNNDGNDDDDDSDSMMWTDVGGTMIALIFHDLLLVLVIASVVMVIKTLGCCSNFKMPGSSGTTASSSSAGFSPNDVYTAKNGGNSSAKNPYNVHSNA